MYHRRILDTADAMAALDVMLEASSRAGTRPFAVAVVDHHGDLMSFARMDGASTFVCDMAIKKAYAAAYIGADLPDFEHLRRSRGRNLGDFANANLIGLAAGGVVLKSERSDVLGAIGVSGGSPEEDESIARRGLQAVQRAERGAAQA
jgi:uncharacterized protein GlcG (DUF336 family)